MKYEVNVLIVSTQMHILTAEDIVSKSININLINSIKKDNDRGQKLIERIEKMVFQYIDEEFRNLNPFPDDLKDTTLYLIESYFVSYWVQGREFGVREKKSEKIDDYSYSIAYERESNLAPLYFFDIPITHHHLNILNSYRSPDLYHWHFQVWSPTNY